MPITVREASPTDADVIVRLVAELAADEDWPLELTAEYVPDVPGVPGHARCCSPSRMARPVGLLAYSLRPGLFHGGESGFIEELVVAAGGPPQGRGRRSFFAGRCAG